MRLKEKDGDEWKRERRAKQTRERKEERILEEKKDKKGI